DSKDTLWVGTEGGGLNRFNPNTEGFIHFNYQAHDLHSLGSSRVWSINEDNYGGLWVGTRGSGLSKITPQRQHFGHLKHQPMDPGSLNHSNIKSIFKDSQGILWVGTNHGLNKAITPDGQSGFIRLKPQESNPNSLSHQHVSAIFEDSDKMIWLGTFGGGLNLYDPQTGQFSFFKHQPSDPNSLSNNYVRIMFEDSNQTLWIGTKGGVNLYQPQSNSFRRFSHNPDQPDSLSDNSVFAIIEDNQGVLWIGTYDGLNRFDRSTQSFTSYQHQAANLHSLSHDTVYSILQDKNGILWIGTAGGLNKYDRQSNRFTHYREKHGLANDVIYAVVEDNQGLLWLSTNKGLSRFDPVTEKFKNYDVNDGLQSNEFNTLAYFKGADGELFFGGVNGHNRFFPQNIQDDSVVPPVVLTAFLQANQPVSVQTLPDSSAATLNQQSQFTLTQSIDDLDHLVLDYQQNLITFEFAALHFTNSMKNQYAYKLEGQDQAWIYTGANNRRATYTNLTAGDYTLRIKASNKDGYWNEKGKSLSITVLPPPWKTWWAYLIYVAIVMSLIVAYVRSHREKIFYERAVNRRLSEVDKLKDQFLANTSHELRTPLNGIIGLAESLIDGIAGPLPNSANRNLAMVVASGRRLANLVNDILDFSKLKNHSLELTRQAVDLHSLTEVVLALSKPLVDKKSGNKSLKLVNNISVDLPGAWADENRLEQILHNLVGNAIKFTETGAVTVSAQIDEQWLTISVCDTGIGIEPSQFKTIFDSFEQLEEHTCRNHEGTGLGLAISKQLVALHGGTIEVKSIPGEGATFSFTLPISDHKATDFTGTNSPYHQTISRLTRCEEAPVLSMESRPELTSSQKLEQGEGFRILLVDDDPINRQVINNMLSLQNYQLVEANGGEQALDALHNDGPFDLVLLDIMMPKVSGYEVCRQLRKTWAVNDLPVIFLTAKNQVGDLLESFAIGANDYLTKPVTKHELLARVATHLKMLDINRNLEQKVEQRTIALQDSLVQLKAAQQQLVEAEKMASLGNLVSWVAHEINTPLGICITMISANLGKLKTFNDQMTSGKLTRKLMEAYMVETQQGLDLVESNLNRAAALIQDFKKVAVKQTDDKVERIAFHQYLRAVIDSIKPQLQTCVDSSIEIKLISNEAWSLTTYTGA
ncbi:MAG: ATP-binding protein, partial [Psychrosphaera sp.]|nr:ATP-binding protein [Psychrosphaera sp.]